jgi:hypothetical protein
MSSYKYFVGGFQLMLVLVFHEVDSFGQESAENPQIQSAGTESISDTEPVLTKEIAERFMLKKEQVILDVFKSITIDAAKVLSASDNFLSLESLTDLPVEAAKYLTLSESSISLRALKEISLELAVALSESQGGFLDLSGLTKLPDEAAMALTKFDGLSLYLGGLTSMSDEVAEAFGMYKGTMLEFSDLLELSDSAAERFCKIHAMVILPSLKKISVPVAQSLAKVTDRLDLGLESITEQVAAELAKSESLLCLDKLSTLTDKEAAALANYKGSLSVVRLKAFPNTPGHRALAQKLIAEEEEINFISLIELSDEVAEIFGSSDGDLSFRKLPTLSPRAAKAFAQKRRSLILFGVTSLSDEAAEELAKGDSKAIYLLGLTEISDRAAEAFADFKGVLDLRGLTAISEQAAESLARRTNPALVDLNKLPQPVRKILIR